MDPDAVDVLGWTPLYVSVLLGHAEVALALIAAEADHRARDADGRSPLHWAAALDKDGEVVRALIAAGADHEARDENGWRPLDMAAAARNTKATSLLREAEAAARNQSSIKNDGGIVGYWS